MDITGATFNFTKKVTDEEKNASPENPIDADRENKPKTPNDSGEQKEGKKKEKGNISAIAYDWVKTSVTQTVSAVMSNVQGSPTLQVQLQAAQQVGGKVLSYVAAAATQNWAALAVMAVSDVTSGVITHFTEKATFMRNQAWADYDLDQYRERRGYSTLRNRK